MSTGDILLSKPMDGADVDGGATRSPDGGCAGGSRVVGGGSRRGRGVLVDASRCRRAAAPRSVSRTSRKRRDGESALVLSCCREQGSEGRNDLSTASAASSQGNNTNRRISLSVAGGRGGVENEAEEEEEAEDWKPSPSGGTGSATHSSQHRHVGNVTEQAIEQFNDAMSLIDPAERDGWERAQKNCPACVLTHECCPCYFLVACRMNPWEAAVRMGSYWRERIGLFEDRAFQPITMGSDAVDPTGFTKEDVEVLMTGAFAVLPADKSGTAVTFCEETRLQPHMLELWKSRARVFFYLFHSGYATCDAQACNFVTMYGCHRVPANGQYSSATWQYAKATARLRKALPICIVSTYLLTRPSRSLSGLLIQMLLSFVRAVLDKGHFSCIKVVHGTVACPTGDAEKDDAEARASLQHQLKAFGFKKNQIPDWAGGQFTLAEFRAWIRRRRRLEQKLFWTAEQHALQARVLNRIKSQRKRQRGRQDLLRLQDQVRSLKAENARAKSDEVQLSQQLWEARETLKVLDHLNSLSPSTNASRKPPGLNTEFEIPDLVLGDPLPPRVLALLEPDPIAPSCLPGRAGQLVTRQDGSIEDTLFPSMSRNAAHRHSWHLGSMSRRTDEPSFDTSNCAGHDSFHPLRSTPKAVSTSSPSRSMFHSCAGDLDSLESETMRQSEVSLDLDPDLLDTLFGLEEDQSSLPCLPLASDPSDFGLVTVYSPPPSSEYGASLSVKLNVEDDSSLFEHGVNASLSSEVPLPCVNSRCQGATHVPTTLPSPCGPNHRQPEEYGVAQRSHNQIHVRSRSMSSPGGDTLPDALQGGSIFLHSERGVATNSEAFLHFLDQRDAQLHALFNCFN